MSKETEVEKLQSMISGSADNEPDPATVSEAACSNIKPPDSSTPAGTKKGSSIPGSKTTGPRTKEGKERSKYNALKHGIFSKIVLLKDESPSEFNSVLSGLRNDLRPEGELEQHLVENLVALIWRHRRLLLAESAAIRKNMEFFKLDQRDREREEAERIARSSDPLNNHGLIGEIHNPDVLERCQQLLFQLRKRIKEHGFNLEYDKPILEKIYGDRSENRLHEDLYDSYGFWLATSEAPEEERLREEGHPSPAQCRMNISLLIDREIVRLGREHGEIVRLRRYQEARASDQTARTQLEIACRNVPDGPALDRLLRSEAHLDRLFDRTLNQLERRQRMRLGQPVLPPLEVKVSS